MQSRLRNTTNSKEDKAVKTIKVAIIYHSETGNTKRMAELIKNGCDKVSQAESKIMSIGHQYQKITDYHLQQPKL